MESFVITLTHRPGSQGRHRAMDDKKKRSCKSNEFKLRVIITHTRNLLWDDDDANVASDDNDDACKGSGGGHETTTDDESDDSNRSSRFLGIVPCKGSQIMKFNY